MNDELRHSGREAIGQVLGYRQLLKKQENDMLKKVDDAWRKGQEVAEVKKLGEISMLKGELNQKHRYKQ